DGLGMLPFGDIHAGTDVALELTGRRKARHAVIQKPPVFAIVAAQPVFHLKWKSRLERIVIDFLAAVPVVGVNPPGPIITELLLKRSAGKSQPLLVDVGAFLIQARHPDHDWRGFGQRAKARLAFVKGFLSAFAFEKLA